MNEPVDHQAVCGYLLLFFTTPGLMIHAPVFYMWSLAPLLLYFGYRAWHGRKRVLLREVVFERPDVIRLAFNNRFVDANGGLHLTEANALPDGGGGGGRWFGISGWWCRKNRSRRGAGRELFAYDVGMYIKVMFPEISKVEWHPFTISSAPEDAVLTVHVKMVPSRGTTIAWTRELYEFINAVYNSAQRDNLMLYGDDGSIGRWKSLAGGWKLDDGAQKRTAGGGPLCSISGPHPAPCTQVSGPDPSHHQS
jgi:hypothetical protein